MRGTVGFLLSVNGTNFQPSECIICGFKGFGKYLGRTGSVFQAAAAVSSQL